MLKQHLKKQLTNDEIQEVINQLLVLTQHPERKKLHNDVILQSGKFKAYQLEKIRDTTATSEQLITISNIREALLYIIDNLPSIAENATEGNTRMIPHKLEQLQESAKVLQQKLETVNSLRTNRLKSKLNFQHKKITQLEDDIEILEKDWLLSMDNERKKGFERRIQSKENEIDIIFSDIEGIEQKLNPS